MNRGISNPAAVSKVGRTGGTLSQSIAILVLACALTCGCQYNEVATFEEQESALLQLAPLGTPRAEVASRLKEAGVSYTSSPPPDPGVFWCESWTMPGGKTFHMFSELRFDEDGRLQEIAEYPNQFQP